MAGVAEVITLKELGQRFAGLNGELAHASFREPLTVARVHVLADVRENFHGGHDPDGRAWPRLKFPRARGGSVPLRDRGLLMQSYTVQSPGHIEEITDDLLIVGSNLEYARLHHHGGEVRPVKGKYLAIPLSKEAARAGSPLRFRKDLRVKFGPRGGLMFTVTGAGRETPHFALTEGPVRIPARPAIGFGAKLLGKLAEVFGDWLERFSAGKL